MYAFIAAWLRRYFSDPDAIILLLAIVVFLFGIIFLGNILAPVIASVIIAYLLDGMASKLDRIKCPRLLSSIIVFLIFVGVVLLFLIWLLPILWEQMTNLVNEFPSLLNRGQDVLMQLPTRYPKLISITQAQNLLTELNGEMARAGRWMLAYSFSLVPGMIEFVVYFILVPLLVFFFLKDKRAILDWTSSRMPRRRRVIHQVWEEVNAQIGNYVRGRILEILIVGVVSSVAFITMGLQYGLLLGVLVGLSVIVPYIGAIVVTVPVLVIGFLQWGWGAHFITLAIVYAVIIALDANILVPLLFAETMNIHPVAIIVAVLFFGGIWGFWGIFFAIPLATAVNAIVKAWPRVEDGTS